MTSYIANTRALYAGPQRENTQLAQWHPSGKSQRVSRNFAYAAAGMYFWEAVHCALYDTQLLFAFIVRLCFFLKSFCLALARREETKSVEKTLGSTQSPMALKTAPSISRLPARLDSHVPRSPFVLNTLGQLTYLSLRLSTSLTLLALLAFLDARGSNLSSDIYDEVYTASSASGIADCSLKRVGDGDASCGVWRAIRLVSSVMYLLSFVFSNMFLLLRVISTWSGCRSGMLPPIPGRTTNESQSCSTQQEGQSKTRLRHKLRLRRSRGLVLLCLLLHVAQYLFIILIGLVESGTTTRTGGGMSEGKLVLGAFVYFAFLDVLGFALIIIGIIHCRRFKPNPYGIDSSDNRRSGYDGEYQHPVLHKRSRVCGSTNACIRDRKHHCTCASLSEMEFARKSDSCEGDDGDAERFVEGDGEREIDAHRSTSAMPVKECSRLGGLLSEDGVDAGHKVQTTATNYTYALESKENSREEKDRVVESDSRVEWANDSEGRAENEGSHNVKGSKETRRGKTVVWIYLCTEGARQGLVWAMSVVLTKVAVLICVLVDDSPGDQPTALNFQDMYFFIPALVIIAIASGRLFLQTTLTSPAGDGLMDSGSAPLLSPSASFNDIVAPAVAHDRNRWRPLYQARPIAHSRVDAVPSYVNRELYIRRVRHEIEAAAAGAVRTVGGSMVLPAPVPVAAQHRRERNKQQRMEAKEVSQRLNVGNGEGEKRRRMLDHIEMTTMRKDGR